MSGKLTISRNSQMASPLNQSKGTKSHLIQSQWLNTTQLYVSFPQYKIFSRTAWPVNVTLMSCRIMDTNGLCVQISSKSGEHGICSVKEQ
jgi:hypothetical protein